MQIYERAITLRQQVGALELIAGLHNGIQRTLMPVETPLLEPRMTAVQAALSKGLLVRPCLAILGPLLQATRQGVPCSSSGHEVHPSGCVG